MNSDIRLAVSFRGHRKRKRLHLLLGPGSTDCLIDLWLATAMNHPSGILTGMDETDIALDAGWEDDPHKLVAALMQCGFLEKIADGTYALHDWQEHQVWAVHAEERKARAKHAAHTRWNGQGNAVGIADGMRVADTDTDLGNAPSPSPSPIPSPTPIEPFPFVPSPAESCVAHITPTAEKSENTDAHSLAMLMHATLKAHLPTFKEPNLHKWTQSFAVALRNDERMKEASFVAEVIKWACTDAFWRGNIQSPDKLREKFDQLTAKMESEAAKARTASKAAQWKSPAARRVEANQEACREAEHMLFGDTPPAVSVTVEVNNDAS